MKRLNSNEQRVSNNGKVETAKRDKKSENNPSSNRLVTDERYAEPCERMRKKLYSLMKE